jgi:hypothetical protein
MTHDGDTFRSRRKVGGIECTSCGHACTQAGQVLFGDIQSRHTLGVAYVIREGRASVLRTRQPGHRAYGRLEIAKIGQRVGAQLDRAEARVDEIQPL